MATGRRWIISLPPRSHRTGRTRHRRRVPRRTSRCRLLLLGDRDVGRRILLGFNLLVEQQHDHRLKRQALQPADRTPDRSMVDSHSGVPASTARRGPWTKTRCLAVGDLPGHDVTGRSQRPHYKRVKVGYVVRPPGLSCVALHAFSSRWQAVLHIMDGGPKVAEGGVVASVQGASLAVWRETTGSAPTHPGRTQRLSVGSGRPGRDHDSD